MFAPAFIRWLTVLVLMLVCVTDVRAATIVNFAGTLGGVSGYSGDGGPATNATLFSPQAVAVDLTGNVFISDFGNSVIRRVDAVTGIITTFAGNGAFDFSGDGGPGTNAALNGPEGLSVDSSGNLYIADLLNNRIRKVNPATGIITTVAGNGTFGYSGDGGPATSAALKGPDGVALDSAGNIYIGDTGNFRLRKVNAVTGIISTIAGTGNQVGSGGDGGPATEATFHFLDRVAVDESGNVFVSDRVSSDGFPFTPDDRVRRIDAVSGMITRVAGGGTNTDYTGPATNAYLGDVSDIAIEAGRLYIAGSVRVWKVNLASGDIRVLAGTSAGGNAGDGGPATDATFSALGGVGVFTNWDVFIADGQGAQRVRKVEVNVTVEDSTAQSVLDGLTIVEGDLTATNTTRSSIVLTNLTLVDRSVTITGNTSATTVSVPSLGSVGGSVSLSGNTSATTVSAPSLGAVGGSVSLSGNTSATSVSLPNLTNVTGSVSIHDNVSATIISTPALGSVGGTVSLSGNTSATTIDLGGLGSVGGSVSLDGNTSATTIDLGGLGSVGGSVSLDGNTSATTIDLGGLGSVGGSVSLSGNTRVTSVSLPALTRVVRDVTISDNASATSVSAPSLATVGGGVFLTGNTSATTVSVPSLATVGGGVSLSGNTSATTVSVPSLATVGGGMSLSGNTSATTVSAPSLATVGGGVSLSGNTSATTVSVPSLATVGGGVSLSGNTSATTVSAPSLATVGGGVSLTGNTSATTVSVPSLATVGGGVSLSGNTSATTIDVGALTSVIGDLIIIGSPALTSLVIGNPTVGGDLSVASGAVANLDLSKTTVTGNVTVSAGGATTVSASTGGGTTSVTLANGPATMTAALAVGTFTSPVIFSVEALSPAAMGTAPATTPSGTTVSVTAISAYRFAFAIPTLGQAATLSFDIDVAALDAASRSAFLAALASGSAALAVKGDAPDSTFQTFAICAAGQVPSAGGCVGLATFNAAGAPVAASDPTVAIARFNGVTGHFSTFAVVIPSGVKISGNSTNGVMGIGGIGLPGSSYVLEATTNLVPVIIWTPLATNTANTSGVFQFSDPNTAVHPQRFYRIKGQ